MRGSCSVVLAGNELLAGLVRDVNLEFLAGRLGSLGIPLARAVIAEDCRETLAREIAASLERSPVVVVSGGLGPTEDDVTREAAADALGVPLVQSAVARGTIEAFYTRLSRDMPSGAEKEALVPRGAEVLRNPVGVAPGIAVRSEGGRLLVLLPGVPRELRALFDDAVVPLLREHGELDSRLQVVRTCGVREVDLEELVAPLCEQFARLDVSYLPQDYVVDLVVRGADSEPLLHELEGLLGWHFLGRGRPGLEDIVGHLLAQKSQSVAVAESLTGGLATDRLTDVPGSSRYVWGAVTAYSNEAKVRLLGVSEDSLGSHGAVSREVASEMATGVRRLGATYGVSLTGIAGPDGGSREKPVGLVYVGIAAPEGVWAYSFLWNGDRRTIKRYSAAACLNVLRLQLLGAPHESGPVGATGIWNMG